jgi:hypothetical protein
MKKLEDIPKTNIYEVPEGYFDRLPGIIQSRVAQEKPASIWTPVWRVSLRYALPVLVIAAAAFWYLAPATNQSPEDILASVESSQLVAYLSDSDVSSEDLLEIAPLDADDAAELEGNAFDAMAPNPDVDDILNDELDMLSTDTL